MRSVLKNGLACAAALGLVMASPAAAATRSANSLPQAGAKISSKQARLGSVRGDTENVVGLPLGGAFIGALIIAGIIIVVAKDNKSPG